MHFACITHSMATKYGSGLLQFYLEPSISVCRHVINQHVTKLLRNGEILRQFQDFSLVINLEGF